MFTLCAWLLQYLYACVSLWSQENQGKEKHMVKRERERGLSKDIILKGKDMSLIKREGVNKGLIIFPFKVKYRLKGQDRRGRGYHRRRGGGSFPLSRDI